MKFSCEKYILQNACSISSRAVPSKSAIPALEGLLLAADDTLCITGFDLRKGIYTSVDADIYQKGSVVINAKLFNDMLRHMPDGRVSFTVGDKNAINIKCGMSEYNIKGFSSEDFPEMPSFDAINTVQLPHKLLKSMINETSFAISTDEVRPIYTGSLFEISGEELTVVAVDGYRLAKRTERLDASKLENCSFVVPGSTLSDVERISTDNEELIIKIGEKHIAFEIGNTCVISRRLEGEFLNYKRAIPDSFKYSLKLDRSELLGVIERVALVIDERDQSPVRMHFNDGGIYCCCNTPLGKGEDTCTCEGSGEGMLVAFNARYLKEALKAANKDELYICVSSATTPCVLRAADGTENFSYMILPVRVKN